MLDEPARHRRHRRRDCRLDAPAAVVGRGAAVGCAGRGAADRRRPDADRRDGRRTVADARRRRRHRHGARIACCSTTRRSRPISSTGAAPDGAGTRGRRSRCRSRARRSSTTSLTAAGSTSADYSARRRDRTGARLRAADRRTDAASTSTTARRRLRRAQRASSAERQLSVGEIIARHQQQQRAQDALVTQLHRHGADGAALPADHRRPRLRRRHREPLLRRWRRRRVGGAVVLGQRIEVGSRPAAVSAAAAREGAVAAAAAAVRRGLPLPAGRHASGSASSTATSSASSRSRDEQRRSIAARSGSIARRSRAIQRAGGAERPVGAGRVERGDPDATRRCIGRQPAGLPVHRPDGAADRAGRRPQPAGREERGVQRISASTTPSSTRRGRGAARATAIMYRETDRGLRYYVKEGGARVVSDRATQTREGDGDGRRRSIRRTRSRCRSSASTISTSSSARPDTQLAMLFAGVLAAGNVQRPKLGATPLDASVDFFAIAVPSSDRVYDAERRARGRARADLAAVDRAQPGLAGHAVPEGDAASISSASTATSRDRTTADDVRRAVEHDHQRPRRRRGNTAAAATACVLNGAWFAARRLEATWGDRPEPRRRRRRYVKYSASLSRDFYFDVFQKIHLNGAWFGGQRPRSLRQVSVRHVRRHAHPRRAGVRRALRASWRWRAARTRSTSSSSTGSTCSSSRPGAATTALDAGWQPIPGIGVAVNVRAPVEYDPAGRRRQELAAGPLRRRRLDDAADHAAEAAR